MGRDWLYWVVGGGAARPSSARRSTSTSSSRKMSSKTRDSDGGGGSTSAGCMCAVFHLFDLNHHHPFSFHHSNHFFQEESITSKGVEAPRNSLEKELEPAAAIKEEEEEEEDNLTPAVGIQIKTRISSKSRTEETISTGYCSSDSPSAKTPSLVARLMGLDLLPDHPISSPSLIISKQTKQRTNVVGSRNNKRCFSDDDISVGARSLPPHQILSARRSDSEYHYIHKENTASRPGHYAKQIVKQVKENVGRRIGLNDITNRDETSIGRRDLNLVLLKPTRNRIGFSDMKKNPRTTSSPEMILSLMKLNKNHESVVHDHKRVQQIKYGKKVNMTKKKDPLLMSNEKLNISGPTLLPVKKDPSPPATKLPHKQVSDALSSKRNTQLSSNTSRSYNKLQPHYIISTPSGYAPPDKTNGCATTVSAAAAAEYTTYVQKILKRTGINDNFTPLALGKWHTPAHPLDPSIYYYLELFHPSSAGGGGGVLSRRCNRKLIFQLVDEILAGILRPHLDFKPWVASPADEQPCLIDEICKRIASFPAANCLVLEDVDSLVGGDLCNKWRINDGFFEEEGERLVCEIEGEIVESLVREAVVEMVGVRPYGGGTVTETGEEPIMSRGGLF
ncbi:hypothetical protein ACP275_06G113500 [Erythranthe tilingii]